MRRTIGMVAAMVAVGVFACGASASMIPGWTYGEIWEMDADMTTPAGAANGTALVANGGGNGTYGVDGFDYAGGIATFLDDSNSSSNQGVTLLGNVGSTLLGSNGYTLDMRVIWLAGCTGSNNGAGSKSMGFAGAGSAGRGLRIDQGWLHSLSSGITASGGIDMASDWVNLRVVVQPDGVWSIYRYLTNTLVLASPDKGNTPTYAIVGSDGATVGPGFFLGSMGGSSTTLCSYKLDYVRVGQGVDIYHDFTPEPASLLLLALGAAPLLRRRR